MGMMSKSRIVVACSILLLVSGVCFNISSVSARSRWKVRWTATVSDAATYYYMEYGCTQLLSVEYRDSGFLEGYAEFGVTVGGYLKLIDFWITGQYESYLRKQYCRWPRSGVGTYVSQHVWYITDENVEQTRRSFLSSLDVSGPHTQYYGPNAGKRYVVFHFPHHFVHSHMIAHYEDYGPDYDSVSDYEYDDATFYHMDLWHSWTRYWDVYYNEGTQTFLMDEYVEATYPYFQEHEVYAHWQIEVTPLLWSPPKIEEIIVTGIPNADNPMTSDNHGMTEKVRLEAKITSSPDFEVTSVWWYGDVKLGEGNPYEYVAAPGTHGKKKVICTIGYTNLITGETGEDTKTKEFNLFFVKWGDDNRNGVPNWFEYWNQIPGVGDPNAEYDFFMDDYGQFRPDDNPKIFIGDLAAGQNTAAGDFLPATMDIGIDTFAETIIHEGAHRQHWQETHGPGAAPDQDGDWLRDADETSEDLNLNGVLDTEDQDGDGILDLDVDNPPFGNFPGPEDVDTDGDGVLEFEDVGLIRLELTYAEFDTDDDGMYDGALPRNVIYGQGDGGLPTTEDVNGNGVPDFGSSSAFHANSNGGIFDDEHDVCYALEWTWVVPNPAVYRQDWANPGKQSDPPDTLTMSDPPKMKWGETKVATFDGSFADYGLDIDGNGLFDYLAIEIGIDVTSAGDYNIYGTIEVDNGVLWATNSTYLDSGSQSVTLRFDGKTIRRYRANGPYNLVYLILRDSNGIPSDYASLAYTTSTFAYTQFERSSTEFTGIFADYGRDVDGDGSHDYLTVEVEIDSMEPGSYTIEGWLYDSNGNDITSAANSTDLGVGSQSVLLNFDGFAINRHRVDGPYNLRYLSLSGSDQLDFIYDAYETSAYSYTDFQKTDAAFTGSYSDYGKDTDGDGRYNYLTVEVEIDVSTSGKHAIIGWLYDDTGAEMVMTTSHAYLDAGSQTIPLDFDGAIIYDHGVNGPYDLKYLALYDEDGALMDTLNYACTTATYDYAQFGEVTITHEVEISISPTAATVEPGASVTYTIPIHNTGNVEDTYDLTVQGLDTAWYSIAQTSVTIDADQTEPVALMVSPPHSPLALKEHIFTVTATSQGDPSVSDSAEAAVSVDFSPVLPEMPTGGLAVAVTPKLTVTSAGTEITLSVTMVNNENFDDTFWLNLTSNGIPTSYQANLAWFNWTSAKVFVPAGSSITLQLAVNIPPEASSGYKIFKAEATSTAWTNGYAKDSGIIRLT